MMKTSPMKRFFSFLLALVMVLSLVPTTGIHAHAHEAEESVITEVPVEEPTEPSEEPTDPSEEPTDPSEEPTDPLEEPTEPTEATEPALVCTCESDDPEWHAPFCALYAAPENPECYCVEKCAEDSVNEWCEVCYFAPDACWASGEEEAVDYAATPTYIASIGIAQDGSSGSTGVNDCKNELSGHTIIDRDLNDGAGGDYVYIGYKTTTDPSKAITGILFRVGENPPDRITDNGKAYFYLVGGSYESNTASEGGYIDLNAKAGGDYIYMYVTRDSSYGAPLTTMTVDESSSKSGYTTGTNTSGSVIDLNQNAGGDYLYLHYKRFSATVKSTYHYLTATGSRTSSTQSATVKNHLETMTKVPSYPTSVTYDGRTFNFKGWREDNTASAATVTSPSATYITGDKTYRAVYSGNVTLSYDANGGSGAPSAQTLTQYINAGSSSVAKQSVTFTLSNNTYTHSTKCFIGLSSDKSATTAAYQPGDTISISSNTTLYAVYVDHSYSGGICDRCGSSGDVPSQSGGVYQITNKAELIWFMQHVNRGNKGANAKVMNNIDLGGYNWTPIAQTGLYYKTTTYNSPDAGYTGTFDGNNKVISNFKITASTTVEQTYGLFGTVSGTVKNLGLTGVSYTFPSGTKDLRAGGIVGQMLPDSHVENSYVTNSTINPGQYIVGGIAACNYGGTIKNCYTYKVTVSGHERCGNLVSDTRGDINTSDRPGTVTNCYTDAARVAGTQTGNKVTGSEASVSDARFASGEIACKLGSAWGQNLGSGALPVLGGAKVYEVKKCNGDTTWSNDSTNPQDHVYVNNICSLCGAINSAAVAEVIKKGKVVSVHTNLNDAIQAVKSATYADATVVKLLQDVNLGDSVQDIPSGTFTLDLNGKTITGSASYVLSTSGGIVTITDSGETGTISCASEDSLSAALRIRYGVLYVTGGTITGGSYDLFKGDASLYLLLGEDGTGATFPGGILVEGTTLADILDDGAAYWVGNTQVILAEDQTEITGGDVVIKAACPHESKTYTDRDNGKHIWSCAGCNNNGPEEDHQFNEKTRLCICGAVHGEAVVMVSKNGKPVSAYTTLHAAIQAVSTATAADAAVVKLLQDIDLGIVPGNDYVNIDSGVFTLDLNGKTITGSNQYVLDIRSGTVTIDDSGENGTIYATSENSSSAALHISRGEVTLRAGRIQDSEKSMGSAVEITLGSLTMTGGAITGNRYGVKAIGGTVSISGGTITSIGWDLYASNGSVTLTLGEDGTGATFPDGINVVGSTTLADILGAGAAYWAGETMLPATGTSITDEGDITIKAECTHEQVEKNYVNNGEDHTYTYSCCNVTVTEGHTFDAATQFCSCGQQAPAVVAQVSMNGAVVSGYTTLDAAIQAVSTATADDKAVVKLLQDIDLGNSHQDINSGVFTLDLNGKTITGSTVRVLEITGGTVTIDDSGENGTVYSTSENGTSDVLGINDGCEVTIRNGRIKGSEQGNAVYMNGGSLTVAGGTITGGENGVYVGLGDVNITDGTITASSYGVCNYYGTVSISGGTIRGNSYDLDVESGTVTLTLAEGAAEGAFFPGGIKVSGTTLKNILGDGAAYWMGDTQAIITDTQIVITGDVTIKKACLHENKTYTDNGNGTHTWSCEACGNGGVTEEHNFGTTDKCICGLMRIHVGNVTLNVGEYLAVGGAAGTEEQPEGRYAYLYQNDGKLVLELKDFDNQGTSKGDASYSAAIWSNHVLTIDLKGSNTITNASGGDGIYCCGDVTITGDGSLEISDANYGIYAAYEDYQKQATVYIQGGYIDMDVAQYGIYTYGNVVSTGGEVTCASEIWKSNLFKQDVKDAAGNTHVGFLKTDIGKAVITNCQHVFDSAWSDDENSHWHNCTVPGCATTAYPALYVLLESAAFGAHEVNSYVDNGDGTHTGSCVCGRELEVEDHVYDEETLLCPCGAASSVAVASVSKNGKPVSAYTTLDAAIQAVSTATAADEAVVKLLQNIDLGDSRQSINSGVFTLDLNGWTISSTSISSTLLISFSVVDLTIADSGDNGRITGTCGLDNSGTVTITGGTIAASGSGVLNEGKLTLQNGTIHGGTNGVDSHGGSTVTICGGTITSDSYGVMCNHGDAVTISGGTITSSNFDLYVSGGSATLTLGEDGTGATFPDDIKVGGTTLADILGEGTDYWQGDQLVNLTEGQTEITGGDVTVKTVGCHHEDDGDCTTEVYCPGCGETVVEAKPEHAFNGNGFCSNDGCEGLEKPDQDDKGVYQIVNAGNLFWIAQQVNSDEAGPFDMALKNNIDLENREWVSIGSGANAYVGTIDGNGYTISNLAQKFEAAEDTEAALKVGFVSAMERGCIRDLTVSGTIEAGGISYAGMLASYIEDSYIYNCSVNGDITSNATDNGGMIGAAFHSVLVDCVSNVSLDVRNTGIACNVGGIVGELSADYGQAVCLLNSYSTGAIKIINNNSISANVGGVVGSLKDDAVNNYYGGEITVEGSSVKPGYAFGYVYKTVNVNEKDTGNETTYTLLIQNNYYPEGNTGIAYTENEADKETAATSVNRADFAATTGETALVNQLNSNLSTVNAIIKGHLGILSDSAWADLVVKFDGESCEASHWKVSGGIPVHCDGQLDENCVCTSCGMTVHMWKDATCEAPKTCSVCDTTVGDKLDHAYGDDHICDFCEAEELVYVAFHSLSLKGNIGVKYYLHIDESILADETGFMRFVTPRGGTVEIPISQADSRVVDGKTYYGFMATVAAKEMTDTIEGQYIYTNGESRVKEYSVKQYADIILANESNSEAFAKAQPLVQAMLTYGAYAQQEFGYNTDRLAGELTDVSAVTVETLAPFANSGSQGTTLAPLYATSLLLKTETTMRLIFAPDATVDALTATINNSTVDVTEKNGYSLVNITNISAKDLDTAYTVTINDGIETADVTYNPMAYCYNVLKDSAGTFGEATQDLVRALYLYNQAANTYFN